MQVGDRIKFIPRMGLQDVAGTIVSRRFTPSAVTWWNVLWDDDIETTEQEEHLRRLHYDHWREAS